jgi:hypothetical protein
MKIIITLGFVIAISIFCLKAQSISPDEAFTHINDSITVCGVVKETHFMKKADKYMCYLEFGDAFPNEIFSVYISDEVRRKMTYDLGKLNGKSICISGKIKLVKKKPEMTIYKESQIQK